MINPKEIINKISELQSTGNSVYRAGLFPSQRVHTVFPYRREDNNIFFSALIAFTLQQIYHQLPADLQTKVENIVRAVRNNYPYFKSDKGTYNFWAPGHAGNFPNGRILHRLNRLVIPDDSDDSSLILLTSKSSKDHLLWYKKKLESHYSNESPVSPLTPQSYQNLRAYPTFFGKKLLREMDACVISNVLYMVCHYQLPWTLIDRDSVQFLLRVLEQQDYQKSPFHISPNYGNSVVILYHISRLVGSFNYKELHSLYKPLIRCLKLEMEKELCFMEALMIRTSILRLNMSTSPFTIPHNVETHLKNYYFFQAGMLTGFQNSRIKWLTGNSFFHLKYQCPAYNWALLLEHQILTQQD